MSDLLAAGEYGFYTNAWKLVPIVILSPLWLRLMTWADKDGPKAHLPRENVNMMNYGFYVVAALAYFLIPNFWAGAGGFFVLMLGNMGAYLGWRNSTVGIADLGDELKAGISGMFGKKKDTEVKAAEGDIVLNDKSGKPYPPPPNDAPERPFFDATQQLLANPIRVGATKIELRPMGESSLQRYTIDGVTFDGKSFPRETAGFVIDLVKILAGMDLEDHRKPQTGKIKVTSELGKHELEVYTAGSTQGQGLRVTVDHKKQYEHRLDTLGMLKEQFDMLTESMATPGGVVLLTAPQGHGLTSLAYAMLRKHDAYLSQIQTIEREPAIDLESVKQNKLNPDTPAEESRQIEWVGSQEPDIIYIDRVEAQQTAKEICRLGKEGKRIYVGMRHANTADAIAAWRKLVDDDTIALPALQMAVSTRLVRRLCDACKIGYAPDPEALRKMNMAADKVQQLFQARTQPIRDPKGNPIICTFCHGMGFKGRTGIFELFKIDDDIRALLQGGANATQLKSAFRKQKQRYMQEAALARVELGDTSIDEVIRVMKAAPAPPSKSSSQKAQA